jgi:hypothetical protein
VIVNSREVSVGEKPAHTSAFALEVEMLRCSPSMVWLLRRGGNGEHKQQAWTRKKWFFFVVQGERAQELKRRPESIQHFLIFLVSVFLFGERDLYCRARGDFARSKKKQASKQEKKREAKVSIAGAAEKNISDFYASIIGRGKLPSNVIRENYFRWRIFLFVCFDPKKRAHRAIRGKASHKWRQGKWMKTKSRWRGGRRYN